VTPQAVDHFVPIPLRFVEALVAGDLDSTACLIGVLVARRCYEVKNTAGGVATVRLATLADLCGVTDDTIERKARWAQSKRLDRLREAQAGAADWLADLAQRTLAGRKCGDQLRATSAPPPHDLRKSPPSRAEVEFRRGTGRGSRNPS
jgi:hypothetical protein